MTPNIWLSALNWSNSLLLFSLHVHHLPRAKTTPTRVRSPTSSFQSSQYPCPLFSIFITPNAFISCTKRSDSRFLFTSCILHSGLEEESVTPRSDHRIEGATGGGDLEDDRTGCSRARSRFVISSIGGTQKVRDLWKETFFRACR